MVTCLKVCFSCVLLISLLKRLHIVLIKTFTMHVEDVSMEIACKSAVYEYVIRYCFIIKEAFVSRHYEEVC